MRKRAIGQSTIQVEASPLLVAGAGLFSAAGDAASAFFGAAPLSSALVAADLSALLSPPCSPARFFLPPDLTSVSYQPPPLRRKDRETVGSGKVVSVSVDLVGSGVLNKIKKTIK